MIRLQNENARYDAGILLFQKGDLYFMQMFYIIPEHYYSIKNIH